MKPEEEDHEAGLRIKKCILGCILVEFVSASTFVWLSPREGVIQCKNERARDPILVQNEQGLMINKE